MNARPPTAPASSGEPSDEDVEALAEVLTHLRKLTPDARARVLYAATSFFRMPQKEQVTR